MDTLGDRIVFSFLDEHDWPPYRSRENVTYISYNSHLSYGEDSQPVLAYRQRVGVLTPDNFESKPLKVTRGFLLAQTTRLFAKSLDLSDLDHTAEPANIDSLSIGPNADFRSLAHPYFRKVRVFTLTTSLKMYPAVNAVHTLPNLVCIVLTIDYDPSEMIPLFTWSFPKLTMFALTSTEELLEPSNGLLEFLDVHSSTLEEIDLPDVDSEFFTSNADWMRFSRLKSITLRDLGSFADALPFIERRWTPSVTKDELSIQHTPPLTITVNIALGVKVEYRMLMRLQPYRDVFKYLTLRTRHD